MRRGQVMGRKGVVWLKVPVTKNRPRGLCAPPPTPPDWEREARRRAQRLGWIPILQGRGRIRINVPEGRSGQFPITPLNGIYRSREDENASPFPQHRGGN